MEYGVKLERSAPLQLGRHPLAPDESDFAAWCAKESRSGRPLALDLFSGAGGLGLGVEAAGWRVVAAADNDRRALETHLANFPGLALDIDMGNPEAVRGLVERLQGIPIDLIVGGPPCQPFSRAGRAKIRSLIDQGLRDDHDPRKELWRSFVDVVVAVRPRAVIMENVPDMAIGDDLAVIRAITDLLENAGYAVDYRLLDAWKHGVPQHRKRFILQARNDGYLPQWPTAKPHRFVVRDAIEDLPKLGNSTGGRELPFNRSASSRLALDLRDSESKIVYDHMTRPVRDDDREAFELMTARTLYSDLPEHLRRYRSDTFNDKYKRLDWDDLSRTITAHMAKDGYWYIHPEEHRTLTVREAARIQTFPDTFRFSGTRSDAFRQIGNAVPPRLGSEVARSLAPEPREVDPGAPSIPTFRAMLTSWALEDRRDRWWLYPGPKMTPAAASIASLLDVHRLSPELASDIMAPFAGQLSFTIDQMLAIPAARLSRARRIIVRSVRDSLRRDALDEMDAEIRSFLRPSQTALMSLLRGVNVLALNANVARVVTAVAHLPTQSQGLNTDIKVATAHLVGADADASLRMCALRSIEPNTALGLATASAVNAHLQKVRSENQPELLRSPA